MTQTSAADATDNAFAKNSPFKSKNVPRRRADGDGDFAAVFYGVSFNFL